MAEEKVPVDSDEAKWEKSDKKYSVVMLFGVTLYFIFILFRNIDSVIEESTGNRAKAERTGYYESSYEGYRKYIIRLINGEEYRVPGDVFISGSFFDKDRFAKEVEYGDELHFVMLEGDEEGVIYQLESNDNVYYTYKQTIGAMRRNAVYVICGNIAICLLGIGFLTMSLIDYAKLKRRNRI